MLQTHSAPPHTLGLMSDQFQFHLHLQYQRQFLLIQHLETCRLYLQEATTPLPSCSQLISISKTVFVYSTTWNLLLVPSRSYDSSSVMFLKSICNLKISSFMAFSNSAKALTFFWNILDILWSFAHNLLYFFLKFSSITIARLMIDGSDTTC